MLHYKTYVIGEQTPWVTLVHGAGANSAIWYKQLRDYKKYFNVLLVDLRGHGKSDRGLWKKGDTFHQVADDVVEVLNHLRIEKSHFIGISLGTIVIQTIAQKYPQRFHSMILGGAVTKLDLRTNLLIKAGNLGKYILPYMWIYKLFAWIIMPKDNHKEARQTFVEQAKKMCQKEFIKWFSLVKRINPFLKKLQEDFDHVPTMFVMGTEDYLFLDQVHDLMLAGANVKLSYIEEAGHVCNIDKPIKFNEVTVKFMLEHSGIVLPLRI